MAKKLKTTMPNIIAPDWKDIQNQAERFVDRYRTETSEEALSKLFVLDFLALFGIDAVTAGIYERKVAKLGDKQGFIDFFLPGKVVVEFKSQGKNLDKALNQATDYFDGLPKEERPRYILLCDFAKFRLHDLLDKSKDVEFLLSDLPKQLKLFKFLLGGESQAAVNEEPVDVKAARLMGSLHDIIKNDCGCCGNDLELLLVRLMFCLFADDAGIFEQHAFQALIEKRVHDDGTDVFSILGQLFTVLNTAEEERPKAMPDYIAHFPYVNGKLFEEPTKPLYGTRRMRVILLSCCALNWSAISPAIFGSMFQTVMEEGDNKKRRELGAHYTSEINILRLIRPLFLDDLEAELSACGKNRAKLEFFHDKLSKLQFLDPACGCGNFLIIAYRELRLLELKVLDLLYPPINSQGHRQLGLGLFDIVKVNVDQFFGIEVEEFPAHVAQVAMWLMDHLMNREVSRMFGQTFTRLPLKKTAAITCGNSLLVLQWPITDYILGNPPFVGAKFLSEDQRTDADKVFKGINNAGLLDYVAAWYVKAAESMKLNQFIKTAFVSTNSICQGEQVGVLWRHLLDQGVHIHFAHRTFQWNNEGRGKAAVHCVIVGFGMNAAKTKTIFAYSDIKGEPTAIKAHNINPYLVDAPDLILQNRSKPLCKVSEIGIGNKPIDGGNYLFTPEEKAAFLQKEPKSEIWFRRWLGADEFINGYERWCLWLGDCPPDKIREMPEALKRVQAVKVLRLSSKSAPTRKLADMPTRFHVENMPKGKYLAIPEVSSGRRDYLPLGYLPPEVLASNKLRLLPNATLYEFGALQSVMHMAWMRAVTGRLKSDYQYSVGIVYNNFPWPQTVTEKQKQAVTDKAQKVLDARNNYPDSTLADMYDPLSMPADLVKAHQDLDNAVDACYGYKGSKDDAARVAFLFGLYVEYSEGQ